MRLLGALAVLTALALSPILGAEIPPIQDYPQQLLHGMLLASDAAERGALDAVYEVRFAARPYVAFYALFMLAEPLVGAEGAGRFALVIYVLLVAAVAWMLARRTEHGWGALLLVPLAFDGAWYIGLLNYLYGVPLLLGALLAHGEVVDEGPTRRRAALLGAWLVGLMLAHPVAALAFCGLAPFSAVSGPAGRRPPGLRWGLVAPAILAALVVGWMAVESSGAALTGAPSTKPPQWIPFQQSLGYLLGIFTGLRWQSDPGLAELLLWCAALVLLVVSAVASHWRGRVEGRRWLVLLALALVAYLALPFRYGNYAYVNLRLGTIVLALAGALASTIPLRPRARGAVALLAGAMLLLGVARDHAISSEMEEVLPAVEAMPAGARFLPILFDRKTRALDEGFFDTHLHVHIMHHVRRRDGLSPYLFRTPMNFVWFREGVRPPAPPQYRPHHFSAEEHGPHYDHFLLRAAPEGWARRRLPPSELVARSGSWTVYRALRGRAGPR